MMKKNISILMIFIFLFLVYIFTGCGGSGGSGSDSSSYTDDISNSSGYVKISKNYKNTITRGDDIFQTVMQKYQKVLDFYGTDSTVFQDMVNTNLQTDAETLTSTSESMYNYNSLLLWEDTEFVIEYEDGTRETIPAAEMLTISGSQNSEWIKDGKKIINIFSKLKDAEKAINKLIDFTQWIEKKAYAYNFIDEVDSLSSAVNDFEQLKELSKTLTTIGKIAGYAGVALSLAESLGVIDFGPSADEIINMKLDYIIEMLEGIYTHLEYIEEKLDHIEEIVVTQANKEMMLNITELKNTINSRIQELQIAVSFENKKATAMVLRNEINAFIQNFIDYSEIDYENYLNWQINYAGSSEYDSLEVVINAPHRRRGRSFDGATYYADFNSRIECTLTKFNMTNPGTILPFTSEALDYLKNLILTRMNINSFIETEGENLDAYNSNAALMYLNNDAVHIAKLRSKVNSAYEKLRAELDTVKNNINGESTGQWTEDDHWTVKDNLNEILDYLSQEREFWQFWSGSQYICNFTPPGGNRGYSDKFSFTPWYSSIPRSLHRPPAFEAFGGYQIHDYLYSPNIVFEENDPVEFAKATDDLEFLDDSAAAIEVWYKAKANKLLEFAASLAALEIQLAAYLDDEDYEEYKN